MRLLLCLSILTVASTTACQSSRTIAPLRPPVVQLLRVRTKVKKKAKTLALNRLRDFFSEAVIAPRQAFDLGPVKTFAWSVQKTALPEHDFIIEELPHLFGRGHRYPFKRPQLHFG